MNLRRTLILVYVAGIVVSFIFKVPEGIKAAEYFASFSLKMLKILPFAFILIGLFQVWVPKKRVEEFLGKGSGIRAHAMAILLASMFPGGFYVSLPVAAALYEKGAALDVVLTFLGASTLVRIPMVIFEISFMGVKFTVTRLAVAVPMVVLSSVLLAKGLGNGQG